MYILKKRCKVTHFLQKCAILPIKSLLIGLIEALFEPLFVKYCYLCKLFRYYVLQGTNI